MNKQKQLKLMTKNLTTLKGERDKVISRAIQNPNSFEAKAKDVLVKKYVRQIKELQARMASLRSN